MWYWNHCKLGALCLYQWSVNIKLNIINDIDDIIDIINDKKELSDEFAAIKGVRAYGAAAKAVSGRRKTRDYAADCDVPFE
ncbi:hypothetical protein J40TS1_42010 [Paenibacillus montaniterrae]|uniref:Uncharacterized protein n=1 Tax=Paenibacillus montaniterrae TaxID=429341 RepID=A0A919YUX0_9BACL|nr:hypothetical protein J40TS1_42010 [Paenibacillus montaniterrae]